MNLQERSAYPSSSQETLWWSYIIEADGTDPDGWWLGHCPIHDKEGAGGEASAQFNFIHGALRCLGEPRCHERRTMSLNNVLYLMARGE